MAESMKASEVLGANFKKTSSAGGKTNKLPRVEGHYVLEVRRGKLFRSKDPRTKGQPVFTVDFKVRESSQDDVAVGSIRSWTQNLSPYDDEINYGMENLKQFTASVFGFVPGTPEADAVDDELVDAICDGDARGLLVVCDTVPKGEEGRKWTLHIFNPYEGPLEAGSSLEEEGGEESD